MAISDTKLSDWTIVSGDNSPGDSKRVGRDLSDELRNIKSVFGTGSMDKGYLIYSYGSNGDYVTVSGGTISETQGTDLQDLDLLKLQIGATSMSMRGDKRSLFSLDQRVFAVSLTGTTSVAGNVISSVHDTDDDFTVVQINWDMLGYRDSFDYEKDMRPAGVGSTFGLSARPTNGMSGRIKVKGALAKDDIEVPLRTLGFLDPTDAWDDDNNDTQQVLSAFRVMDPALTGAYTASYFVSLQLESFSHDKKLSPSTEDGSGAANINSFTVTRVRKYKDKFTFCLLDAPGVGGRGAKITAVIEDGKVTGYTVTEGGTDYLADSVSIAVVGGDATAGAITLASTGSLTAGAVGAAGDGYTAPPVVEISDDGNANAYVIYQWSISYPMRGM